MDMLNQELAHLGDLFTAISEDLLQLAHLHDKELNAKTIQELKAIEFPHNLGFRPNTEYADASRNALYQAIEQLNQEQELLDRLASDYAAIYLTNSYHASPYESVWTDENGLIMQQSMFQIRKWYAKYNMEIEDWRMRSDDHLVLQMQFIAMLSSNVTDQEDLEQLCRFLDEHLLRWIDGFAQKVAQRSDTDFYAALALSTSSYLIELRDLLEKEFAISRPSAKELEQRLGSKTVEAVELGMPKPYVPGTAPSW